MQVELIEWKSLRATTPEKANALTGLFLDDPRLGDLGESGALGDRLTVGECRFGLTLQARQHVGVLQLGPVRVSIRPKMSVSELWGVVCYAYGFDHLHRTAPVDLDLSGSVVDLLCQLLLAEVERLWRAGIGRAYQSRHGWLGTPRGRLDVTALARRGPLLRAELPCHYHPFSTDTPDNRLVRAALARAEQLATAPRLSAALARASQRAALLAERRPLSAPLLQACERGASRLNAQYASTRQLAALLFDGGGMDDDHAVGASRLPGFLWNMAGTFERFVTRFLQEHTTDYSVSSQARLTQLFRLDAGGPGLSGVPTPRPDLIARDIRTGQPIGVYDMKYRDLWTQKLPRDMLYQLSTYALAVDSDAPSVVLYPGASGRNPDMRLAIQVVGGRQRQIIFRSVDWSAAASLVSSNDREAARVLARRWLVG